MDVSGRHLYAKLFGFFVRLSLTVVMFSIVCVHAHMHVYVCVCDLLYEPSNWNITCGLLQHTVHLLSFVSCKLQWNLDLTMSVILNTEK